MPPAPKFTREEVLEKALRIVRTEGESALTARRLGTELGASSRPIFTLFSGMDELKQEIIPLAYAIFNDYFVDPKPAQYFPEFKGYGLLLIRFATEEPNLFEFLFVSKRTTSLTLKQWSTSPIAERASAVIMRDYKFDLETAKLLFLEVWLHTFSLCVIRATGAAQVTDQEASDSISRCFVGMFNLAKAGRLQELKLIPVDGVYPDGSHMGEAPTVEFVDPRE